MAFTPRAFDEILAEMIAYVRSRTEVSDFNPGSVIRTILEAAALEDGEQYFQMVQLLDMLSYTSATGDNLDRRLADFNIARLPAKSAYGYVKIYNKNLTSDQAATDANAGDNSFRIFDAAKFPTSGYPYTIRIGEGTSRAQDKAVTAFSTLTGEFTLSSGLTYAVLVGDRVSLVTGSTASVVSIGVNVVAPATNYETAKTYQIRETAYIAAGNYYSNEVLVESTAKGDNQNVSAGRVTQFQGSSPFSGAGVISTTAMEGGRSRERDEDYRARAVEKLQSLAKGTPNALRTESIGVEDGATGQRVISANIVEDYDDREVIVYVDDGTGLEPSFTALPQTTLDGAASIGDVSITVTNSSAFPSSGTILIGLLEKIDYHFVDGLDIILPTSGLVSGHLDGSNVAFVDVVTESAESGQRRFRLSNYPVVRNTDLVYKKAPLDSTWTLLTRGTDYIINRGIGELFIVDEGGLEEGTKLISSYTYYTNLIAEVQKVLEGDPTDPVNYPGVKAAGVFLSVEAPTVRRITIDLAISAEPTYVEADLAPLVRQQVENYISSLKMGDDVIISKIIDAAHNVTGVKRVLVSSPESDIVVLENELPVAYDNDGVSLVTVL